MSERLVRVPLVLAVAAIAAVAAALALLAGPSPPTPVSPERALVAAGAGVLAIIELGIGRRGFARPNAVSAAEE